MRYTLADKKPTLGSECYIAPGAHVIGDVTLGDAVSVWFNAVIRGDVEAINIGNGSNVQDGAVLHADPGSPLVIGQNVTLGHKVMAHGCRIGDNSLVGINAVILNGAEIGKNCVIGANALITEGKKIPEGSVVMGSPGKVVKQLTSDEIQHLLASAQHYQANAKHFAENLEPLD